MKRKHLRFGEGFRVSLMNARAEAAEMVIAGGDSEGSSTNHHQRSDQWLFVVAGSGIARVNGKRYRLRPGSLMLIEHGDRHEIRNEGEELLKTLNFYTPPGYDGQGNELPAARPSTK